jgi:hypothetical protein
MEPKKCTSILRSHKIQKGRSSKDKPRPHVRKTTREGGTGIIKGEVSILSVSQDT